MSKFNLGDFLNKEVFSKREFKDVTNTIGNIGGKFLNFGSTMMNKIAYIS